MTNNKRFQNERIWIIGASAGIGKALAKHLDSMGAKLILSSRDASLLNALGDELVNQPDIIPFDVSVPAKFSEAFSQASLKPIDRIVYLPAVYKPMLTDALSREAVHASININFAAVFSLLENALPYIKQRPSCQLAVTASVAGYVGLPNAQPYASTKAAVLNLMESVKAEHANWDIKVINPGFVKTRLTDKNDFKMPCLQTPEQAADQIAKGLLSKGFEIHFPKRFTRTLKLLKMLPYGLYFNLVKGFGK